MKPTLEDRQKTIIKEVEVKVKEYNQVVEQRRTLDRKLSTLQQDIITLQGQKNLVDEMIKDRDSEKTPDKVEDKKPDEKTGLNIADKSFKSVDFSKKD